ncbi:butyrophilin-like protein 2 isoform X2 [Silurus meridionalis]|nr:butyrophilin-like protein 2 isoform X2 [Silurus meridionalis]
MEIRWFKGTDCICVYQNGQVREGKGYEGRVSVFTHKLEEGNVSLMLRNVQQLDDGSYKCKVTDGKDKVESDQNALRVREFKLITESYNYYARPGDEITLPCYFSAEVSAVAMKIRWFKGTNCICVYNNGQLNEGKGYEDRVSLFTQELEEGNVSLMLRNLQESDDGEYKCEVTHQERKLENSGVYLHVTELKLITETHSTTKSSVAQPCIVYSPAGDEVILPCKLSANVSAVAMEIRWFKGANCIFVYQNGKVRVCKGYEDRMRLFTQELEDGNVSVGLKNFQESDVGEYKCVVTRIHEVTHRDHKMESSGVYLYMSEFSLVHMPEDVGIFSRYSVIRVDFGHDVTLPCYLNPKQSAFAMEIRWFIDACYGSKRKIICICQYQNGEVKEAEGYEGRVSLFIDKLEEGNVSLMLKNYQEPFLSGQYICEVTCGNEKERFIHHLILRLRGGGSPYIRESSDEEGEPETRTRKLSDPRDLRPIKPGRRWSNPLDLPNM